jgi:aryl-alcohol dehydrogenase-like predicted oxidoreductase
MQYEFLGQTGVKVSEICFGTMTFGGDSDEKGWSIGGDPGRVDAWASR